MPAASLSYILNPHFLCQMASYNVKSYNYKAMPPTAASSRERNAGEAAAVAATADVADPAAEPLSVSTAEPADETRR
jgi:hypothetical protein